MCVNAHKRFVDILCLVLSRQKAKTAKTKKLVIVIVNSKNVKIKNTLAYSYIRTSYTNKLYF